MQRVCHSAGDPQACGRAGRQARPRWEPAGLAAREGGEKAEGPDGLEPERPGGRLLLDESARIRADLRRAQAVR